MSNRKIPIINSRGEPVILDDDSGVVPPGHGVRVSMMLQDAMQREIAASSHTNATMVTDAFGRKAGSRPGYCYGPTGNSEAQARAAYDTRSKYLADAWRTPTVAASVSDQTSQEKRRKLDDPEAAYEARKAQLSNAWRTTSGVGFGPGSFGGDGA